MDATHDDVAARVAEARKLAGLTQAQLAMRAHLSVSLVRKVERRTVPASPTFIARAYLMQGTHDRVIQELSRARQLSPQQTRYHPQVHETIRAVARARRRSDPVTRLAVWAGVD